MATYPLHEIYRDIATLPDDKLVELRQFIDFLRFKLKPAAASSSGASIMSFAGSWQAMDDSTFVDLMDDIKARRHTAFAARRAHESSID